MGLALVRATLSDWRCAHELEVGFSPAMTVLVGPNASGKTNTVEVLQLLTAGTSFRRPSPADLVRQGCEAGRAELRLEGDGRVVDVACIATVSSRRFTRNGKAVRPSAVPGTLLSVLFTPDDLDLVKGPAKGRRGEVDGFGSQANAGFSRVCRAYARSVEQRNRLLKDPACDLSVLDAWDASVALGGATLLYHRMGLVRRLAPLVQEVYGDIAGGERLEVAYRCTVPGVEEGMGRDAMADAMAAALAAGRADDLRRGATGVGPHRDDVDFSLEGRPLRTFGSQGQQRTAVLAWKLAQVRFAEERLGERPVLLLDDVMSELDGTRRSAVSSYVDTGIQTVVTTTHLGYFDSETLAGAEVVPYGERA